MGSTRAEGRAAAGDLRSGADLVAAAAALRWARPDLTAALADHVLEEASAAGEQDRWLTAAGWAVHARSATGDGRQIACDVLAGLKQWDDAALASPAAGRLRVELAMVAAGAGEVQFARDLIALLRPGGSDPELGADLLCVQARCAVEEESDDVTDALDAAGAAWAAVGGTAGEIGGASVALISAVVQRRAGRPDAAVVHAADGLARLERGRGRSAKPSVHLAAALAAEWISALLDAGRAAEAWEGCSALLPRLSEQARPSRQLALLRLTVARAVAGQDTAAHSAQLLEQAAEDAAAGDVPDLEAVCRTALGALQEQAGHLETALETLQRGVAAERRDRSRSRRFRAALAELPPEVLRPEPKPEPVRMAPSPAGASDAETTTLLPLITRGDRKLANSRRVEEMSRGGEGGAREQGPREAGRRRAPDRQRSRSERAAGELAAVAGNGGSADEDLQGRETQSWNGAAGESPIGELLRSVREANGSGTAGRRNGRSVREWAARNRSAAGSADGSASATTPADRATGPRRGGTTGRRRAAERSDAPDASWLPSEDQPQGQRRTTARRSRSENADPTRGGVPTADPASGVDDEHSDRAGSSAGWSRRWGGEAGRLFTASTAEPEPTGGTRERHAQDGPRRRRSDEHSGSSRRSRRAERAAAAGAERAAAAGAERAAAEDRGESRGPRGRHGRASSGAAAEGGPVPDGPEGAPHRRGHRHRADESWSADRWSPKLPDPAGEGEPAADHAADDLVRSPSVPAGGDSADSWLSEALAELDRALSGLGVGATVGSESAGAGDHGTGTGPTTDRCMVVIDIARDGRRFAGRRAGSVIRGVADRLTDRLPAAAELRFGELDTLEISEPGWTRTDATDWMHRTLPGLLDGFVADEDLPGAQLRAAVHDPAGPVGAQILQNLARPPARKRDAGVGRGPRETDPGPEQPGHDDHDGGRAWPWSPAAEGTAPDSDEKAAAGAGRAGDGARTRRGTADDLARARNPQREGSRRRGSSGEDPPADPRPERAEPSRGAETTSTGGSNGHGTNTAAPPGGWGSTEEPAAAPARSDGPDRGGDGTGRAPGTPEATEPLGIADLLAGALAAYRGI